MSRAALALCALLCACEAPSRPAPAAAEELNSDASRKSLAPSSSGAAEELNSDASRKSLAPSSSGAAEEFAGSASNQSPPAWLEGYTPRRAKLVGHTSLVLRLDDAAGHRVAFRAAFKPGGSRYRGEIAAYRLAQALGLDDRVPLALPGRFSASQLEALLSEGERARFREQVLFDRHGVVAGAIVPWLSGLAFLPFERAPWSTRVRAWLQLGRELAPEEAALAAQFSDLLLFDFLSGNFDRWSGGNLAAIRQGDGELQISLCFLDNDGAFLDPMPQRPLQKNRQRLLQTARFSRARIERLRALYAESDWQPLFGELSPGVPLLSAKVTAGVRARAGEALAHVDAQLRAHGEQATLAFP